MKIKELRIEPVELKVIRNLIETLHYTHSVNGLRVSYCFGLYDGENLIGGILYGKPAMRNAWKKYAEREDDIVELRRLVIIDDTPPNAESYFIGRTIRWLTQHTTLQVIVSYADNAQGHSGTIYKASNFQCCGETSKGKQIEWNGRLYHDKSIRTYYTNAEGIRKLKPYAQRIRDALDRGDAKMVETKTKNIFVYRLRNRAFQKEKSSS